MSFLFVSFVFAHQGGWDEAAFFAVPIVLAILAVRWVDRRNRRRDDGDG